MRKNTKTKAREKINASVEKRASKLIKVEKLRSSSNANQRRYKSSLKL